MLDYQDETDSSGTYSSVVPYWTDGTTTVVGDRQDSTNPTITGRGECVPLDVSDRFESQPTKAQVEAMGLSVLNSQNAYLPTQNISVSFVRLQDMPEYAGMQNLLRCGLCDTIKVIFPDYNSSGQFKIVKTVWDVLGDTYEEMELGDLSISLSEALGITDVQKDSKSTIEQIIERLDKLNFSVVRSEAQTKNISANGNATFTFTKPTDKQAICTCGFYYTNWTGALMVYNLEFGSGTTSTLVIHNGNSSAANNVKAYVDWLCIEN